MFFFELLLVFHFFICFAGTALQPYGYGTYFQLVSDFRDFFSEACMLYRMVVESYETQLKREIHICSFYC